jgi:transcriptional regulator with XRE-family HTH domain
MPNNPLKPRIGQQIRAVRREAGLTLKDVGQQVGISNQALSAIERGKKNPSRQTLMGLARVFGRDFGERWLAEYLSEYQAEFHIVPANQGLTVEKNNLMQLFKEFLDTKYGPDQFQVVPDYQDKGVLIPISAQIKNEIFDSIDEVEKYLIIPPQMVPPDRGAVAIINKTAIPDAFVNSGDIIIMTIRPDSFDGKLILAFVDGELMIRRCKVKGRKATLHSIVGANKPITVPIEQITCLGEVTGLIRLFN